MIVGLTGGIGTGKSTVARMFSILGVPVYNSDSRAKELYYVSAIKEKVLDLIGKEAYLNNGLLNREYISKIVFSSPDVLARLNAIIHPAVEIDFKQFCEENKLFPIIIKETALLFEAGIDKKVHKIILVTAPLALRLQRIKSRDQLDEKEILKRIANQMKDDQKLAACDYVISNDEKTGLIPQVTSVFKLLQHA